MRIVISRFISLILTSSVVFAVFAVNAETLRVEPLDLSKQLKDGAISLVDSRPLEAYSQDHLPGAVSLPIGLTYKDIAVSGEATSPEIMQEVFRKIGLSKSKPIVVYGDGKVVDASRLFWLLEVYGFENVKILNGGYPRWKELQLVTNDDAVEVMPSDYVVSINNRRIATKFATQLAMLNPNQIIIDARPEPAYRGETSTAQRFGHIPSALNINFQRSLHKTEDYSYLQDNEAIRALFSSISKDKQVIAYCEVGRASSVTYLTLRELGYDVANYDASWREWGNDLSLPIEKGDGN